MLKNYEPPTPLPPIPHPPSRQNGLYLRQWQSAKIPLQRQMSRIKQLQLQNHKNYFSQSQERRENTMQMGRLIAFWVLFLGANTSVCQAQSLANKTFMARVIGITDGDTMEVLYQKRPIKIRLAHIDAPEQRNSQPFGKNAKQALSTLCFAQQVTVYAANYDRYKRLVAVIVNQKKQNVNQEMLKLGMAWHFTKYSSHESYAQLETAARKQKIGLWQDANPTPPWNWRKPKK